MANELAQRPSFSMIVAAPKMQRLISNSIADPKAQRRFTSAIVSAVSVNAALAECEPFSIISAGLLGESLGLSPSPQLGQYYMVPYKQKEKRDREGRIVQHACTKAQFQLGYKGYVQLAIRSLQYRKLNVVEVRRGELVEYDPFNEEAELAPITDFEARENAEVIGYYAMFELTTGFVKTMFWSKEKMLRHADRFSPAFSALAYKRLLAGEIPDKDKWKYSSFWYSDFDAMAKKTMLRQIISKWGPMSIDFQTAFEADDKFISTTDDGLFLPEAPEPKQPEHEQIPEAPEAPALPEAPAAVEIPMPGAAQAATAPVEVSLDDL